MRFGNRCQIAQKTARVAGTQQAVNSAGRGNEMSYQIAKTVQEVGRDIEASLCSGNAANAGSASVARKSAGVARWLWDNNEATGVTGATTGTVSSGVPGTDVADTTVAAALTETRLKTTIQDCWEDGGNPTLILCSAPDKVTMSGFSGIATQYKDNNMGPATIVAAADYYVSDFGTHQIVASHFMPSAAQRYVGVIDLEHWEVCYLRGMQQKPLSKTGDSDRTQVLAEYTLACLNHQASGKVSGVST